MRRGNRRKAVGASSSAGNKIARAGAICEGTHGSCTKGTEQAEQTLRTSLAFVKEFRSRAARRNKRKPLFQEAPVERRATMEVEDVNPSWDQRERHIIMEMESRLQLSERTWVGPDELERVLLSSADKMCIATISELALEECGHLRFVISGKLWGEEVADAARFAEQARNEEETIRIAELRKSKLITTKVSENTRKKMSESEEAIATLRAENGRHQGLKKETLKTAQRVLRSTTRKGVAAEEPHRTRKHREEVNGEVTKGCRIK